uniref:Sulfotransferase domain-containing protein n=2 Tax=Arion vulgaris TaxID=1028688 RepID=A0A0B6ZC73_9EUPU
MFVHSVQGTGMELKKVKDAAGNSLTVLEYEGRWLPDFPREALAGMKTFKAREDDVIVCAYPKSGTHWVWEMVRILLAGTTDLQMIEKDDGMMEYTIPEELERTPSPRSLNTHYHFEMLPASLFRKKCRIVYITRDPKDVAVSYYNHHRKLAELYQYEGEWKDYFPLFLSGQLDYESWFAYTKGWEQGIKDHPELPIHITSYEELQRDTFGGLKKLAAFLGVETEDSFLIKVVKKCSFDTMRATKGTNETFGVQHSPIMYRKGKVGDWKNWFTIAQYEQLNDVFEKEMTGTRIYELYSQTKQRILEPNRNIIDGYE